MLGRLVGVCLSLVLAGCSASYKGERLYWKAQRLYGEIGKDAAARTPERIAKAMRAFETVIAKVPHTVWAARAHVVIASLSIMQRQHHQGREMYAAVLRDYSQFQDLCVVARYAIARSFEAEGHWEEAVKAYGELADYHPWHPNGLMAPLYVGKKTLERGESSKATRAFERAVQNYTRLIPNAPTSALASQAKSYLAVALEQVGKWERAIALLEELREAPGVVNRPMVLMTLASLYQRKALNPEQAKALYTQVVEQFPNHPFAKVAKAKLDHLNTSPATPEDAPPVGLQVVPDLLPPTPISAQ